MQLIVSNIHQKSIKLHFFILIAVVLANGWLLLTTGQYLLKFCIIANEDVINSLNIHQKSMEIHFRILIAVVLANGGLLLTTGHYLLKFCIIANEEVINSFK